MSVPRKYRQLGDFHKYYSGEAAAPVLTIVIGGNHEASNYLFELYYGGWLAPNIYYLGAAGVVQYGPWRIAGISGIYNSHDYNKAHCERLPYSFHDIKSIYHVRRYDVDKFLQLQGEVDIGLSHDWPAWVELFGNYQSLYSQKPHFFDSAKRDGLGSYAATETMNHLRPLYWFSGHMHCRFPALIRYTSDRIEDTVRKLDVTDQVKSALPVFSTQKRYFRSRTSSTSHRDSTAFLALDKHKDGAADFLEVMELDMPQGRDIGGKELSTSGQKYKLRYDEEWLAITRAYAGTLRLQDPQTLVVPPTKARVPSTAEVTKHKAWVHENISQKGLLEIPANFVAHAPSYNPLEDGGYDQPREYPNLQTAQFQELLQIPDVFALESIENEVSNSQGDGDFVVFEED
jgi:lariat debranching enzyme